METGTHPGKEGKLPKRFRPEVTRSVCFVGRCALLPCRQNGLREKSFRELQQRARWEDGVRAGGWRGVWEEGDSRGGGNRDRKGIWEVRATPDFQLLQVKKQWSYLGGEGGQGRWRTEGGMGFGGKSIGAWETYQWTSPWVAGQRDLELE